MSRLDERVALVTGSSRGIGAAIATRLAAHGARVALHGRDEAALARVRASIERAGGRAIAVTGDVTRFSDLEAMRAQIEAALGPVDILVANAGGNPVPPMPVDEMSEETWRATVDLNLTSTFLTVRCFLPGMKQRGRGNIITISSSAARRAHPRSPIAYAAAKAAIELFTQDVAAQMGPHGIRANCVAPETILTEDNAARIPRALQESMAAEHPLRRLGVPDDVAEAALFLASDASAWVTGIVVDVAGGAVMPR
jgi:3-oxoacyl-[acyl-carrier protein] reductase